MDGLWNNIMFNDIGAKIKKLARFIAWFDIVVSILGGIAMIIISLTDFEYLWYLFVLAPVAVVFGCLSAWLSVIMLYGFGEIIDKLTAIEQNTRQQEQGATEKAGLTTPAKSPVLTKAPASKPTRPTSYPDGWTCTCGVAHAKYETSCECGRSKAQARAEANAIQATN